MEAREKKRSINRLKSMYALRAKVDESYKKSGEAVAAGEPAVWSMANWWEGGPILKAMGIEVVYPENYGAACSAAGVVQDYLDRSDAAGFPTHLCGYARNTFGYTHRMMRELGGQIPPEAPMGGMPKPALLLASAMVCDARYKWFQGLGRYLDAPVWNLEMPIPGVKEYFHEGAHEACVKVVVEELKGFISFLERLFSRKLDWAKLEEVVSDMLELNRVWYDINELRKAKPCPMHSRDFWSAMPPSLYLLGDIKECAQAYKAMYQEVKAMADRGEGAVANEKYRMAFAELPPWHSLGFFEKLADRGWNFVVESWFYHPPIPIDYSDSKDPLEKIARQSIQFNMGYYKYALPEDAHFGYVGYPYIHWAKEFHFDGMFAHPLITCRSASTHLGYVREALAEKVKVPTIWLEGDICDLRLFDPEEALRKAEAFEEIMDHYRAERKKAGFEW